jgi:hypothetical protein
METTTAARLAWITTAEAAALGGADSEVVITSGAIEEEGDTRYDILERYRLGAYATLQDGRLRLASEGWRVGEEVELPAGTELDAGHYLLSIEKI